MSRLPAGWTVTTLREVCLPVSKAVPSEAFRYIDISSIDNSRNQIVDVRVLDPASAPSRARQHVRAGDVVLSTVRTYLRNTAQVPRELEGAIASTGFCVLRPGPALVPRFLFYRCLENSFVARLNALQTGSSYPAVRDKDVRGQEIGLPPVAEQERIVAAVEQQFSRLDDATGLLAKAHQRVDACRLAVLSRIAQTPAPLTRVADIAVDKRYGTSVKCSYEGGGLPVLRIPNVQHGRVDTRDLKYAVDSDVDLTAYLVQPGDLLFVRTNGSRDLVGRVATVKSDKKLAFASYLIRARLDLDTVDPSYVSLVLAAPRYRVQLEALAATTAGQYNLNLRSIGGIRVPLPSIEEQQRQVEAAEHQLSVLDALTNAIDYAFVRSGQLRRAILREAFSGRLVPQDPTDQPARELLARIAGQRRDALRPRRRQRV
jgi:type I restriction enzyme S subunit